MLMFEVIVPVHFSGRTWQPGERIDVSARARWLRPLQRMERRGIGRFVGDAATLPTSEPPATPPPTVPTTLKAAFKAARKKAAMKRWGRGDRPAHVTDPSGGTPTTQEQWMATRETSPPVRASRPPEATGSGA